MSWNHTNIYNDLYEIVEKKYVHLDEHVDIKKMLKKLSKHHENKISQCFVESTNKRVLTSLEHVTDIPQSYKKYSRNLIYITQVYKPKSVERELEIIDSLQKNIDNKNFKNVYLFVESGCENILDSLDIDKKVKIINISQNQFTYRLAFELCLDLIKPDDVAIIGNTDCYFLDDVELLKHLDYGEKISPHLFTFTRYEYTDQDKLELGIDLEPAKWSKDMYSRVLDMNEMKNNCPLLEPWSNDAWAFDRMFLDEVKDRLHHFEMRLGKNLCEIKLQYNVHNLTRTKMYNIGFSGYVKLVHNHQTCYREKHNWMNSTTEIPDIFPTSTYPRTFQNSITDCYRLLSGKNWLDSQTSRTTHKYTDYVVNDVEQLLEDVYTKRLAVLLITTEREIQQGCVEHTLDLYMKNRTKLMFDIVISCPTITASSEKQLRNQINNFTQVKKCEIITTPLDEVEDIYWRPWRDSISSKPTTTPALGLSNGPNKCFFDTMRQVKDLEYKNIVMIETDTSPMCSDWFDKLYDLSTNDFLIMGSKYKGKHIERHKKEWHFESLNGVALYKNNSNLHDILDQTEQFITTSISNKHFNEFINYDVAIGQYMKSIVHNDIDKYKDSAYFVNASLDDEHEPQWFVDNHKQMIILHHKNFKKTVHDT